jgi:hypothetical protein
VTNRVVKRGLDHRTVVTPTVLCLLCALQCPVQESCSIAFYVPVFYPIVEVLRAVLSVVCPYCPCHNCGKSEYAWFICFSYRSAMSTVGTRDRLLVGSGSPGSRRVSCSSHLIQINWKFVFSRPVVCDWRLVRNRQLANTINGGRYRVIGDAPILGPIWRNDLTPRCCWRYCLLVWQQATSHHGVTHFYFSDHVLDICFDCMPHTTLLTLCFYKTSIQDNDLQHGFSVLQTVAISVRTTRMSYSLTHLAKCCRRLTLK